MAEAGDVAPQAGAVRPGRLALACGGAALALLAWGALAPLAASPASRERAIEIPAGTAALLAAGGQDDALPNAITLTLGVQDVLLLKNADAVAQQFGPVLLAPGQVFRLPFEESGVFPVASTAWAGKRLTVTVVDWPTPGWERLSWRLASLGHAVRYWPRVPAPGGR